MIRPPTLGKALGALAYLRAVGTIRQVKAKGTDEDEAELRAWQRDIKRRSHARRRAR